MFKILTRKKRVIYFPGCIAAHVNKEISANWQAILTDLGIEFELADIDCCGSPAYTAGYLEEFQQIINRNKSKLGKPDLIISNCPHCLHIFDRFYEYPVKHTSQVLADNLEKIRSEKEFTVTYHDPCTLARKLGITEEPRLAIKAAGANIEEFKKREERTLCCGASGGMIHNNQSLAKAIGKNRIRQAPAETIVVCCPLCHYHLKNCANKEKVIELSELFVD